MQVLRETRGHIGDTLIPSQLLLERHPVRPCTSSLLKFRLVIPLSRRKRGFKPRRGRQQDRGYQKPFQARQSKGLCVFQRPCVLSTTITPLGTKHFEIHACDESHL